MSHYLRTARMTACGLRDFHAVTVMVHETGCEDCRAALKRKFGIHFPKPTPKTKPVGLAKQPSEKPVSRSNRS